ncbi:hypothetical protein FLAV_02264 [Flavobacteriales bacterium]|nr:hypothetical protein [Flavobacteriales bacterium]CAG0990277.1 hypothetical protein FLAV_02264 [Flavobacteriales bacterium]
MQASFPIRVPMTGGNTGHEAQTAIQEPIEIKLDETADIELEQEILLPDIFIYLNPSNGLFTIESEEPINPQQIEVYDIFGKRILPVINQNDNGLSLNLTSNAKGTYFIKIGTYSQKMVVE